MVYSNTSCFADGQCRCGDTFGTYGVASNCNTPCNIGSGTCGGSWANSVYLLQDDIGATSLGCYADSSTRDLPYFAGNYPIHGCTAMCQALGYWYAGVQYCKSYRMVPSRACFSNFSLTELSIQIRSVGVETTTARMERLPTATRIVALETVLVVARGPTTSISYLSTQNRIV